MDMQILDPNPLYLNKTYRLRFRFTKSYPIGISVSPLIMAPITNLLSCRSPRSHIHHLCQPASGDSYAPTHLLQWHHMSGPSRLRGMEPGTERGERLHEHPEHADGEREE